METISPEDLTAQLAAAETAYQALTSAGHDLDLTRGKPSREQLDLSNDLDGILQGGYNAEDGTDLRNYGTPQGLGEARRLFGEFLDTEPENTYVAGASSLTLMYQLLEFELNFGTTGAGWRADSTAANPVAFLCPVPGYDRHFSICEHLGIGMIPIEMTATGPDMDQVETAVQANANIKGIWCVPRFSNPTGTVYSEDTVARLAALPRIAGGGFRIIWDNAYAFHALYPEAPELSSLADCCRALGTEDGAWLIGSTSKITHAGSGVAFSGSSRANTAAFMKHLGYQSIGPDKVNQRRQVMFLKDVRGIQQHMERHAEILRPRFDIVQAALDKHLGDTDMASWSAPLGGYFVSVDTRPGLAKEVVRLAADAGVRLTPAGATFPHGHDAMDRNIRLAPSFPTLEELAPAMDAFVICVKLASLRQEFSRRHPGE